MAIIIKSVVQLKLSAYCIKKNRDLLFNCQTAVDRFFVKRHTPSSVLFFLFNCNEPFYFEKYRKCTVPGSESSKLYQTELMYVDFS